MNFSRDVQNLIANLRQLPEDNSSSAVREPKAMAYLIDHLAARYPFGEWGLETIIMEHWGEILGDSNAHYCRPQRFTRDHRLVVVVANPVIRQELCFQKRRILQRIRDITACYKIKGICFVVG